jgi:hypothetical protein
MPWVLYGVSVASFCETERAENRSGSGGREISKARVLSPIEKGEQKGSRKYHARDSH